MQILRYTLDVAVIKVLQITNFTLHLQFILIKRHIIIDSK